MVKIGLQICANLENVEELRTCHPDYAFFVKIKCSNCGEESDKWHDLTESERVGEDSRNPDGFNFYAKCKLCNRENSMDILKGTNGGENRIFKIYINDIGINTKISFQLPTRRRTTGN